MKYIPKTIHLVWFGGNPYSNIVSYCIESWKKICPDYDIKVWNEETFDVTCNKFVNDAYQNRKWAFVSDYVRLYALYNYGGVYIDSDVELLQSFEPLFENEHCVTGYEGELWIPAAIMAAEPKNEWIKLLLDYYEDRSFVKSDGSLDMKANTAIITELSKSLCNFKMGDNFIEYGKVRLYPTEYFQPYKKQQFDLKDINQIENNHKYYELKSCTYCIHHNTVTWVDEKSSVRIIKSVTRKLLPKRVMEFIRKMYYRNYKW